MMRTIAHRGPDGEGTWCDPASGVGLAHRRLAILDLSDSGRQPMRSAGGRYVVTFNGEIYNFAALRSELTRLGHRFHSRSDTEVMLAAFEQWGISRALRRFRGMYAFAAWDAEQRELHLARDPIGKKPLYVHQSSGELAFGSELRPLWAWTGGVGELDPAGVRSLLEFGYVRAPHSICKGIRKLLPGELVTVRIAPDGTLRSTSERTWQPRAAALTDRFTTNTPDESELVEQLESLLAEAVELRMVADVPVGLFLSGGLDSALVAALMRLRATTTVQAYTVGFDDPQFDETGAAQSVARYLDLRHEVIRVSEDEVIALVPELPAIYDEPFADASQIPTVALCRATRRHATVALSGDGGDESFAGYNRYVEGRRIERIARRVPGPLVPIAAAALAQMPSAVQQPLLSALARRPVSADQAQKLLRVLRDPRIGALYGALLRAWPVPPMRGPLPLVVELPEVRDVPTMRLADFEGYLPDDVLVKVDRASMSIGLEVRSPLLDVKVVELALGLPPALHFDEWGGKRLLRRVLERHVPRPLWDRPKAGFTPPLGAWLRGPLREWAEDLLRPVMADRDEWLQASEVSRTWQEHLAGRVDAQGRLWTVLTFLAWRRWARLP
jgi:asparagine synthase (glutamine-hydrolysing)